MSRDLGDEEGREQVELVLPGARGEPVRVAAHRLRLGERGQRRREAGQGGGGAAGPEDRQRQCRAGGTDGGGLQQLPAGEDQGEPPCHLLTAVLSLQPTTARRLRVRVSSAVIQGSRV